MRIREVLKGTKKYSAAKRLELAALLLGLDLSDHDNHGQILLYTGMKWNDKDHLVNMKDSDYE